MTDYAPCISVETFAYFHRQNSPEAWLQDQKQYLLDYDTLIGTSLSACRGKNLMIKLCISVYPEVVFIQRLHSVVLLHLFQKPHQFSLGELFSCISQILAEGIDGATLEGINCLLAAEAFQSNWMKTKCWETRLCFTFSDCSSASFWTLQLFLLAQKHLIGVWGFLQFFSPSYRLSAPVS